MASSIYKLDGFEFSFKKKDRGLFIQADHLLDSRIFSKFLTRNAVETLSRDHSLTIDTLFQLLEDYFKNKPEKASLTLSSNGFLYYSCQILFGHLPKQFDFNLKLDNNTRSTNNNVNILNRFEQQFQDIAARLSNLESREYPSIDDLSSKSTAQSSQNIDSYSSFAGPRSIQSLISNISARFESIKSNEYSSLSQKDSNQQSIENNSQPNQKQKEDPVQAQLQAKMSKIQERFSRFDNRLSVLEKRPTLIGDDIEVIVCKFTTSGPFSKSYNFRNDNRTAEAKFTQPVCVASDRPLPKYGKHKFAFLVENADYIMVGVTNTEGIKDKNCFSEKQTFAYEGEGRIWREGKASEKIFRGFAKGDIISFVVDSDTGIIDVFLNRTHTLRHRISEEYLKDQDLYPFLHTDINEGCCATFI